MVCDGFGMGRGVEGVMGETLWGGEGWGCVVGCVSGMNIWSRFLLNVCTIVYMKELVRLVRHANHRCSIRRLFSVSDDSSISDRMVVDDVSGILYNLLMSLRRAMADRGMLKYSSLKSRLSTGRVKSNSSSSSCRTIGSGSVLFSRIG